MATRGLVAMVGAGAAIVAAVVVMVRSPEREVVQTGGGAKESAQQLGVRGEAVDSAAVRGGADGPGAPAIALAGTRPATREAVQERGEALPPAPPTPPSADAVAQSEAILAVQPRVLAAVDAALEEQRVAIRRRCWKGEVPASASFPVEASYGADGTMLAHSVGDSRGAPGVGGCVREQANLVPPTIDAPGVSVTVKSALTLP